MDSPRKRFLLRGSLALAGMLAVWWLILLDPALAILRVSASLPMSLLPGSAPEPILQAPSGDWIIQVPAALLQRESIQRLLNQTSGDSSRQIRFVKLKLPRTEIAVLLAGLPLFWAILVAAPGTARPMRAWVMGTALLFLVAVVSMMIFAGYTIETKLDLVAGGFTRWLLEFGDYLAMGVLPYVTPCLVAMWLDDDLRRQVFSWVPTVSAMELTSASRKQRRRLAIKKTRPELSSRT